ncbi:MAG: tetratricopeptide repeat protein, partial [Thermodesulfobacteriota bacterium]|nr:tetratricopeptide repeat protein [Thermodesulfobacteriota bacterium]
AIILQRLPGATLFFKTRTLKSEAAADFCKKRFTEQGIAPEKIIIDSNNYPTVEHFESYNRVDIALDPFPYNGTTTTCDALWMGVPVITLKGKTHAARVGTSLLTAIGCPELIAENETDYVEKAISLAKDPARLDGYHARIRSLIQDSPLMDASGFARNFSQAILSKWQEWRTQQLNIFKRLIEENDNILALPPGFTELLPTNPTAITLLHKAIENNRDLHLLVKLGQKYANEERLEDACICFRKAVAEDGNNAIYRYVLANILQQLGYDDEALQHYRKALALNPQQSDAATGLSSILRKQNESEAALEILLSTLKQNLDNNKINFELANVYYDLGRLEEAYKSLCSCLKFEPNQAGIWNNLGYLMAESGKLEKATECYRKALSIDPDLIESRTNLIWQMAQTCSWQERDKLLKKCNLLPPLTSVILESNPNRNLICAQNAIEKLKKETQVMPHQTNKKQEENDPIKIGYISCDFRDHPVAHNILNLFRLHDRKRFHITAYSCGPSDNSSYRQQISKDCDRFVDLKKLNDYDSAKKIYADKIDILIELMGHTRENRLGILAYRPAPIQISYLGYPGTTGADFIDYLIADEIVIPPEHKIHYSEKVIYLNDCFMIADRAPIGPSPKRSAFGLPEKGFIFCSFNSPFKIEPVMFKVWMDIMTAIPDSYLWLRGGSERFETNLKN